jgi:hypothetical protein
LAKRIAKELNVSNCWVCGGTHRSEEWPWKGASLNAYQLLLWSQSITRQESNCPQTWILTSEAIGEEYIKRTGPGYEKCVGETRCMRVLSWNGINLTCWPDGPKWYWALPPSENGSQCHDSPTNDSLLNCSTTAEVNPFRGIPDPGMSPILTRGSGGHHLRYFGYVGSELIPNSLGLGRELYYRSYPAWVLPLAQPPRGTAGGSPL